jgi:adenylosuccinate lyase
VEQDVAKALGLTAVPATQVIARDRHAEYLWACASVGTTIESIAVELRHLQRSEVGEVREGFKAGQKGSSAMPHKRNPISAETLTGLSRVLRGHLATGMQNVALWHERDISHSSAERIVLPDASILTYYVVRRLTRLIAGLEVDKARMSTNIAAGLDLVYSQSVLLALVDAGLSRDDAYRLVQEASATAWTQQRPLREVVAHDARMGLSTDVLAHIFNERRMLRNAHLAVESLDSIGL